MTREKVKEKTFNILRFVADNAGLSTFEAIEKAYNVGVSEQESILDKIRAEIERLHYHPKLDFIKNDEVVEMALDIIDKYKTESEDK